MTNDGPLGARLDSSDNALNALRLLLASLVLVSHTSAIGGFNVGRPMGELAALAVDGFFALSGYLILASRMRTQLPGYLRARVLRIFPGLWVNLLATAFFIAVLAGHLENGAGPAVTDAWRWVWTNALLWRGEAGIPGTLARVPFPGIWNGSLWTLGYEVAAYVVVGLTLALSILRAHVRLWVPALALLMPVLFLVATGPAAVHTSWILETLRLSGFFLAGMAAWTLRDSLPLSGSLAVGSALLVAAMVMADGVRFHAYLTVPLTYLLIYLGARLPIRWGQFNDLSYGIYIYAFPVQQLMAVVGIQRLGFAVTLAVDLAVTAALACGSWFLIEKPALRLKRGRTSGAGRR